MKQIIILLTIIFFAVLSEAESIASTATISDTSSPAKQEAYAVLQAQCNTCHRTQNPTKVFTTENMNGFAKKIKRQVFVWKRMPKGNENKLTEKEKEILKTWLDHQLKK